MGTGKNSKNLYLESELKNLSAQVIKVCTKLHNGFILNILGVQNQRSNLASFKSLTLFFFQMEYLVYDCRTECRIIFCFIIY